MTDSKYIFVNPKTGNREIWMECPKGYMTVDEWEKAHPTPPPPEPTIEEIIEQYNAALENKLKEQYNARGYTVREPSDYKDSPVVRYRQDAKDYELHKGRAMIYGLTKINECRQSGVIPTLDEFLDGIGDIHWTIDPDNTNPNEGMVIEE